MHWLLYYIIFAYIFHYWVIFIKCKAYFEKNHDATLRSKYAPFVRNDMHVWHDALTIVLIPTAIPRLAFGTFLLAIYGISTTIIMIGIDAEKIDPWRHTFIRYMGWFVCRGILLMAGVVWMQTSRVQEADYRHWLGPDWEP